MDTSSATSFVFALTEMRNIVEAEEMVVCSDQVDALERIRIRTNKRWRRDGFEYCVDVVDHEERVLSWITDVEKAPTVLK